MAEKRSSRDTSVSRRKFVAGGAVAAAMAGGAKAEASVHGERDPNIKIPSEVPATMKMIVLVVPPITPE